MIRRLALLACVVPFAAQASPSHTLDAARAHHALACGVVVEQEDFTKTDSHGDLSVFSSQICRAIAAASLGDANEAHLVGFPDDPHGIAALRMGSVAVLVGTTPNAASETLNHLRFSPTLFIDGQGFLLPRSLHVHDLAGLRGHTICFLSETPADGGLAAWHQHAGIGLMSDPYEEAGEMEAALTAGHCQAITADVSTLANMRAAFHGRVADFEILAQRITYDPFAAATRADDSTWTTLVADVVTALIEADQDGITRGNLAQAEQLAQSSTGSYARRLLGPTPGLASLLGLRDGWAARALAVGGNYGEILAATTGPGSRLDLPPGPNALWNAGGLIGAAAIE
ncbi:hypothetical protein [Lichenicoccus sp.]|uniref:hypothetical protein n=1 Tax=Lichenicoccus sp. TaxID=2781899 RepID=UPI003D0E3748